MGRPRGREQVGRARCPLAPGAGPLRFRARLPGALRPGPLLSQAIPAVHFGQAPGFTLGVEEELIVVDPATLALSHAGVDVLERMRVPADGGFVHPDTYSALVELASPVCANADA